MAEMTNADLFQREFGIYATELWAMPEQQFLAWLNTPCDREREKDRLCGQSRERTTQRRRWPTLEGDEMVDDLISRQAAIDAFNTATSDGDKADWCVYVVRSIPSAQKTGWWESSRPDAPMFGFYYCSECGRRMTSPMDNYCPNCGSRNYKREDYRL